MARTIILIASVLGFSSVSLGAFGAHALKAFLTEVGRLDTFELAVRYQFYHTLALLAVGILLKHNQTNLLKYSAYSFISGIIFFSGSLYALCFTGHTVLGAITPFGGLLFLCGWTLLALSTIKK